VACQEGPDALCSLTLEALKEIPEAADDLQHLVDAIRLLAKSFSENGSLPVAHTVFQANLGLAPVELKRLGALLRLTSDLSTGGSWPVDGETFSMNPGEEAVFFLDIQTVADYDAVRTRLASDQQRISRIRAAEFQRAQENFIAAVAPTMPSEPSEPARYHLADAELDALLQRDLAELESVHAVDAWKAAAMLAGSCLEALLLDLCKQNEAASSARFGLRWPRRVSASELAAAAEEMGLISPDHRDLASVLRRWRDIVHPAAAMASSPPSQELADVLRANLRVLIADLSGTSARTADGTPSSDT
jgi:hypothetical protein